MLKTQLQIVKNSDANINLFFNVANNLTGSDDLQTLVTEKTNDTINPVTDGETLRFTPSTTYSLAAYFYNTLAASYQTNVAPNEFASSAVTSTAFLNSLYVINIFDSPLETTQTLLYTGYLNGYNFNGYSSAAYTWSKNYEYGDIHLPNSYIDGLTGTTVNIYMKLNFYSAKSGKVYPFSRLAVTAAEVDLYDMLTVNLSSKTYTVTAPFSFYEIRNAAYVNNVNDAVSSLSIEKPVYPSGNTFTTTGHYITM